MSSLAQRLSDKKRYEGLLAGEQLGLQKGKQLGLREGEQLGLQKGRRAVILKMLHKGASPATVSQFTDITVEEIEEIASEGDKYT